MSETCRGHLWDKIIIKLFASSWYIFLTYISLGFTFPSFFHSFCPQHKAVDGFSANRAAAYRSFFPQFITAATVFPISSTYIPGLFPLVIYLLTFLWYLYSTTLSKFVISDLLLSSDIPEIISPIPKILTKLIKKMSSFPFNKQWICKNGPVE